MSRYQLITPTGSKQNLDVNGLTCSNFTTTGTISIPNAVFDTTDVSLSVGNVMVGNGTHEIKQTLVAVSNTDLTATNLITENLKFSNSSFQNTVSTVDLTDNRNIYLQDFSGQLMVSTNNIRKEWIYIDAVNEIINFSDGVSSVSYLSTGYYRINYPSYTNRVCGLITSNQLGSNIFTSCESVSDLNTDIKIYSTGLTAFDCPIYVELSFL